jgi:hypothetical protein
VRRDIGCRPSCTCSLSRWVHATGKRRNLAEVVVADGEGFEFTDRLPYCEQASFRAAEREAREHRAGPVGTGSPPVLSDSERQRAARPK